MAVTVAGRLACYRVLDLGPRYSDRAGHSLIHEGPVRRGGARVEVTIGSLPDPLLFDLSNAVPAVKAQAPAMQALLEHARLPDLDRSASDLSVEQPDFVELDATYLTLAYVRPATVLALPDRWAFWTADTAGTLQRLHDFKTEANQVLDRACARLPGATRDVNSVVLKSAKAYYEPIDGTHMPVVDRAIKFSARGHVTRSGWATADHDPLLAALDRLWSPTVADTVGATPAWLMYQAMDEQDDLKRFLFAHWGLEALAAKFSKHYRKTLTKHIIDNVGLPADELFWPTPEGTDRPGRSIVFTFALMAWALKADKAPEDIARFKKQADLRNKLSHGERLEPSVIPRHDAYSLLREYLSLANAYTPPT